MKHLSLRVVLLLVAIALLAACGKHRDAAGQAYVGTWVNAQFPTIKYIIAPDPNSAGYLVTHSFQQDSSPDHVRKETNAAVMQGSVMDIPSQSLTLSIDAKTGNLIEGGGNVYRKAQ